VFDVQEVYPGSRASQGITKGRVESSRKMDLEQNVKEKKEKAAFSCSARML
jgi:hypothetical protein